MNTLKKMKIKSLKLIFLILSVLYLNQCAEVLDLLSKANIQEPSVKISNIKMTGLTFNDVDLLFNIDINNPNSVGINLTGFDYDLQIEHNSFISGKQENGLAIKASGSEIVQLPLTLKFKDIYNTFSKLKDLDSVQYKLNTGLSFNLPVLGNVRIPVSKSGKVPALKMPSIGFNKIKMDQLKLTGAELTLQLKLDNPNTFTFVLKNMNYKFNVAGTQWINGKLNQTTNISAKQENIINIPISLNFISMGQSVYNIIKGDQKLTYTLNGNAELGSSLSILGDINLPFNQTGSMNIEK